MVGVDTDHRLSLAQNPILLAGQIAMLRARSPVLVFLAQSDMENFQAFKEELQSDRNRVFRLVTGGTGA